MAALTLRNEERIGLALALAAHGGLVAWLALNPPVPAPLPPPERMTVTLSDDVALTSTSPQAHVALVAAQAPDPGEQAPPATPQTPAAAPATPPPPIRRPLPIAARPAPAPALPAHHAAAPFKAAAVKPAPPRATVPEPLRASRIGADFLLGHKDVKASAQGSGQTATSVGPAVKAALSAAIVRQVKPHWQGRVPQGVDTEKLVSIVGISLNSDGSLAGAPQLLGQEGINDSNRNQARRHGEEAIRAVELAAPFDLPAELYQAWKKPPPLRMRKSL